MMELNQNEVRDKVHKFIVETGTTQAFICDKVIIPRSTMSLFLKGKKDLWIPHLMKVNDYIDERQR